jgi:hypothetical protein
MGLVPFDPVRLTLGLLAGVATLVLAAVALLVALATALVLGVGGPGAMTGALGALPGSLASRPSQAALGEIPPDQLAAMREAAATAPCPLDWSVLAGVARVESSFGSNMATSSAGAIGYGQFLPSTWAMPGIGNGGDPYDYHDALPAMARYLCASGAGRDVRGALYAYNHDTAYVDQVLAFAGRYATSPPPASGGQPRSDLAALPPLDQYDRSNYRSAATWAAWKDAACSAASLAWLLRAYGDGAPDIDDAIDLIGRGSGITTAQGLSDHTGSGLASALGRAGLSARRGQLGSIAQLEAWLDRGPLLLDGQTWFFAGHWFVATGYDAGGVFIRDSSGHDTPYLSWGQLYGMVGFSGWAVGVDSTAAPAPEERSAALVGAPAS